MNDRKLSEEAGLDQDVYTWNQIQLKDFAKLIRADEREQISHTYLKLTLEAVLREREACAKLCEGCMNQADPLTPVSTYQSGAFTIAEFLAIAIRQRGEQP